MQGAHHEREGIERPDRTPSRSELRQQERTGISGKEVRAEVTAAFERCDTPQAFQAALEEKDFRGRLERAAADRPPPLSHHVNGHAAERA